MPLECSIREEVQIAHSTLGRRRVRKHQDRSRPQELARCGEHWDHLLTTAFTLDKFDRIKSELLNYSLAEGAARSSVLLEMDQLNMVKGKGRRGQGRQGNGRVV